VVIDIQFRNEIPYGLIQTEHNEWSRQSQAFAMDAQKPWT
jgi:hypothetical protein